MRDKKTYTLKFSLTYDGLDFPLPKETSFQALLKKFRNYIKNNSLDYILRSGGHIYYKVYTSENPFDTFEEGFVRLTKTGKIFIHPTKVFIY